jgi:hypothetical protein
MRNRKETTSYEFLDVYYKNNSVLTDEAIEAHPVAIAIVRFMNVLKRSLIIK